MMKLWTLATAKMCHKHLYEVGTACRNPITAQDCDHLNHWPDSPNFFQKLVLSKDRLTEVVS